MFIIVEYDTISFSFVEGFDSRGLSNGVQEFSSHEDALTYGLENCLYEFRVVEF